MTGGYSDLAVRGFRTMEGIWREFLSTQEGESDAFLRTLTRVEAEDRVLEFVAYLVDSMEFTGPQVIRSLTQLRGIMTINGGCYDIFDSKRLEVARKSIRSRHVSLLAAEVEISGEEKGLPPIQLPVSVNLLDRIRELYWAGQTLTSRMIYIGSIVSFFRGLRVSNVAATGSTGIDHRFRLSSIRLEVEQGFMTVGEWLDAHSPPVSVLRMDIKSSKTHGPTKKKKRVAPIVLMAEVGSFHEQQLLTDLLQWIKESGMRGHNDLLFARLERVGNRRTATYKMLQSADVAAAIKRVVAELGLDPARYSTRSLRIGANVEMGAQGATSSQRMSILDHAEEKTNVMYLRAMHNRDPNPLRAGGSLTADDIVSMERHL